MGNKQKFLQNKLYCGKLSLGCRICIEGNWSCMYINGLCTADCLFCPQDRKIKRERPPRAEGVIFDDPRDYVDYLEKFGFKGVSFSGGECLLVFDKLLLYAGKIKERFGKKIYIWLYTNGDLLDSDKLRLLKEAGFDEIRLNVSARNYDFEPVKLSGKFIKTVTVEIPAIPEDLGTLKKLIGRMEDIGVAHLNLHQLFLTKYNYKNLAKRGYTLIPLTAQAKCVLESEKAALNLIKYAMRNGLRLPINYCSGIYKEKFQGMGTRNRLWPFIKDDFFVKTSMGYVKRLSAEAKNGAMSCFEPRLRGDKPRRGRYKEIILNRRKKVFIEEVSLL